MTHVISLTDEVYAALAARKSGRSFTRTIADLLENTHPPSLRELAGRWKGDDAESIFAEIMRERHREEPVRVEF